MNTYPGPDFLGAHFHRVPLADNQHPASPAPTGLYYQLVRTHDAGVAWADINPAPGVYNTARMDAIVGAHPGKKFVHTLYGTPAYALKRPSEAQTLDAYGRPGGAGAPNPADVYDYVCWYLTRYKGVIKAIEIWNEPLFDSVVKTGNFFWGSASEMFDVGLAVRRAVNTVDPTVEVWSPGFMGGDTLRAFLDAGNMMTKGKDIIDVVCFHNYGGWLLPDHSNIITGWNGVAMVRNHMAGVGIPNKKIALTECGIGESTTDPRLTSFLALPAEGRYANRVSYYSALFRAGVAHVFPYAYDSLALYSGDLINDLQGAVKANNDIGAMISGRTA